MLMSCVHAYVRISWPWSKIGYIFGLLAQCYIIYPLDPAHDLDLSMSSQRQGQTHIICGRSVSEEIWS